LKSDGFRYRRIEQLNENSDTPHAGDRSVFFDDPATMELQSFGRGAGTVALEVEVMVPSGCGRSCCNCRKSPTKFSEIVPPRRKLDVVEIVDAAGVASAVKLPALFPAMATIGPNSDNDLALPAFAWRESKPRSCNGSERNRGCLGHEPGHGKEADGQNGDSAERFEQRKATLCLRFLLNRDAAIFGDLYVLRIASADGV